jgi:hypothetical protein
MQSKTISEIPDGTFWNRRAENGRNSHIRTDCYETGIHIAFLSKLKRQSVLVHKGKNSVSVLLFHGELTPLPVTEYILWHVDPLLGL